MLSLILFRHGKSDWDAPYANDHERPLANRGKEAARCMGRLLSHTRQVPGEGRSLRLGQRTGGFGTDHMVEQLDQLV